MGCTPSVLLDQKQQRDSISFDQSISTGKSPRPSVDVPNIIFTKKTGKPKYLNFLSY